MRERDSVWAFALQKYGSHIDASHSRQPLVKGERLVRYEVNAVMSMLPRAQGAFVYDLWSNYRGCCGGLSLPVLGKWYSLVVVPVGASRCCWQHHLNLPGWCWAEIQQFALVGSSSSLHSEACNALGASDGVIHSRTPFCCAALIRAHSRHCLVPCLGQE